MRRPTADRRPTSLAVAGLLAVASLVLPSRAAHAQPAPAPPAAPFALTLDRPDAEHAAPYTSIGPVRELRDGRVVVADRVEKVVDVVDLARGGATRVGAEGGGPTEYRVPTGAYAMPGDSTLVFDAGAQRYLVVSPEGAIVRSFSPMRDVAGTVALRGARAVDAAGNLYFLDRGAGTRRPGRAGRALLDAPDSGTVVRHDPRTGRTEAIGRVGLAASRVTAGGTSERRVLLRASPPLAAHDDWTVGPDGRLAVVRHDPYRVEWVAPNGRRIVGPTIAYERVRVTDADKQVRGAAASPDGQLRAALGAAGAAEIRVPMEATAIRDDWPEFKPPFLGQAATVAPDGRLWVLRTRAAGDDVPSYDVFDGWGARVGTVTLPPNGRLVGFGRSSAYVVRTDADDLQYLQRYRLF